MEFVSNGLLGAESAALAPPLKQASPTPEPIAGYPQQFASPHILNSNGLLGRSPSPLFDTFVPNGLLSNDLEERIPSKSGGERSVNLGAEGSLVANGLLSVGTSQETDGSSDLLSHNGPMASQNDIPSVYQKCGHRAVLASGSTSRLPAIHTHPSRISIPATTFDGKTVSLKRKVRTGRAARALESSHKSTANLLEVPIHRLMDVLAAEAASQMRISTARATPDTSANPVEDTLWVDRYRPHRFTDLMGNERVARETMAWVKRWDWCVFGKKKGKKRQRETDDDSEAQDEYHRPQEKLLLIAGPPGLGKTTLAHVVAHQAGYEVMEINASDARSGSIVDDRIRPALESGSAVGSNKPVLLIIDEIDGATGSGDNSSTFIHKLVQLTFDKQRKKLRSGQARDPQAKRPILRPIICICNDINAASLAKLRPHALQIRFNRPADIHTVKRLKEVCALEGMRADTRALSTLVGVAKGDLRGCLNTLQFIKSRNEDVTENIIRKATVGMKEAESSIMSVVNSLFTPVSKKRVKELAMTEDDESRYVARLSREVDGSGRESGVAIGCFTHYATLRQHDTTFSRYEKANEWLITFDALSVSMYADGDFALNPYLPYMLVPFYPLFNERGARRIERSQEDWEALQQMRANEEIYRSLSRGLRTASTRHGGDFRHFVNTPILQLEFAPYINRIISPPLRPVNHQIIRPEDRKILTRLVSVMAALELRFFQERGEDGQFTYRLDPPIDVFVTYDSKRAVDISVSRYAVRHLVAGEIDALLNVKNTDAVEKPAARLDYFGRTQRAKPLPLNSTTSPGKKQSTLNPSEPPTKRARIDLRDIADKPPTDFFGRLITTVSASSTKAAARKNVIKEYRVTYRFAEGNSAAVRKPVKISAFI